MRFRSLHVTQSMQIKNIFESWWKNKIHSIFCSKQHKWLRQELWLEKKNIFICEDFIMKKENLIQLMATDWKDDFYTRSPTSPRIHTIFFLPISICFYIFNNVTAEWVLEKKSYLDYLKGPYFTIKPPPPPPPPLLPVQTLSLKQ